MKKRSPTDVHDPTTDVKQSRKHHAKTELAALSTSITSKIEDGYIKAALRLLFSEDKPAAVNDATFNAYVEKHPVAAQDKRSSLRP